MAGWVFPSVILLLNAIAGSRMEDMKSSVIGGQDAKEGAWPWMAFLFIQTSQFSSSCGGTIINNRWILTAAHCVAFQGLSLPHSYVRLGAYKLDIPSPNEATYTFSRVIIHPDYYYQHNVILNDIALVNVDRNIIYSHYIKPVSLAEPLDPFGPQSYCFAIGWGMTGCNTVLTYPMTLQQLNIPLGFEQHCDNAMGFICAGAFGKLVYKGDSGGPLMCYVRNNWVQAGISSYVKGCDWKILPAYFTRVSHYRYFINQYTRPSTQEY